MTREMEDIELVIKINENDYHRIVSGFANEDDAILFTGLLKNGAPLPKGHGRLIDADAYIDKHEECGWLDDITLDEFNTITQTIIKADRAESEG